MHGWWGQPHVKNVWSGQSERQLAEPAMCPFAYIVNDVSKVVRLTNSWLSQSQVPWQTDDTATMGRGINSWLGQPSVWVNLLRWSKQWIAGHVSQASCRIHEYRIYSLVIKVTNISGCPGQSWAQEKTWHNINANNNNISIAFQASHKSRGKLDQLRWYQVNGFVFHPLYQH